MAMRPTLFTRGLSGLSQSETNEAGSPSVSSPAEQRDGAKRNFLKTMRPLPTQHYWNVYFDRQKPKTTSQQPANSSTTTAQPVEAAASSAEANEEYQVELEQLGDPIESVQDFWRYNNNTPVHHIKMRESIYLFKSGFRPVWEDRRNLHGGSWTFRVPKSAGPEFWTHVQLLAIGERLEEALEDGDQLCGVGLSVRFNSHLITIWNRDASRQGSIQGMLNAVLEGLPEEKRPKPENYYYKKHSDHSGFQAPPEMRAMLDSQARAKELLEQKRRKEEEEKAAKKEGVEE